MSGFYSDVMTSLLQAIDIEKGRIPMMEVDGMPGTTFRTAERVVLDPNTTKQDRNKYEI